MATVQILTATTAAEAIRKGFNAISLSNWSSTAKPLVKIGSTFELGGAVYQTATADQDTDPAAAYAGLASGYVYGYATDAAGTITFSVSSTAPTWDEAKQGWYNGAARCLYRVYKPAGGTWNQKKIYKNRSLLTLEDSGNGYYIDSAGVTLVTQAGAGNTTFTVYKPIATYIVGNGITVTGTVLLEIKQVSATYRTIQTITFTAETGPKYIFGIMLLPGEYRLTVTGTLSFGILGGTSVWDLSEFNPLADIIV